MEQQQPRTLEEWTERFKQDIAANRVFIFAKGEKNAAMCGFSHRVMEVFNRLGVDYGVQNIFADPMVRPAICAHTDWPTIPQVFVDGKFVGGCDIVMEMYESGELQKMIEQDRSEAASGS